MPSGQDRVRVALHRRTGKVKVVNSPERVAEPGEAPDSAVLDWPGGKCRPHLPCCLVPWSNLFETTTSACVARRRVSFGLPSIPLNQLTGKNATSRLSCWSFPKAGPSCLTAPLPNSLLPVLVPLTRPNLVQFLILPESQPSSLE